MLLDKRGIMNRRMINSARKGGVFLLTKISWCGTGMELYHPISIPTMSLDEGARGADLLNGETTLALFIYQKEREDRN